MRNRLYLIIGVLGVFFLLGSFFVYKVFGSEDSIFVEGCTPYNVSISKGEDENSVEIEWESKRKCTGYILYGGEIKELGLVGVDLKSSAESKSHVVILKGLLSSKRYYFTIMSNESSYGKDGLPLQFSIDSL